MNDADLGLADGVVDVRLFRLVDALDAGQTAAQSAHGVVVVVVDVQSELVQRVLHLIGQRIGVERRRRRRCVGAAASAGGGVAEDDAVAHALQSGGAALQVEAVDGALESVQLLLRLALQTVDFGVETQVRRVETLQDLLFVLGQLALESVQQRTAVARLHPHRSLLNIIHSLLYSFFIFSFFSFEKFFFFFFLNF